MTRVHAIYARVSSEEQARDGLSLEMQVSRCREKADGPGITIREYIDDGYTGTNPNRPAYQQMLSELQDIDAVYVWRMCRLVRHPRSWYEVTEALAEADVGLHSLTDNLDLSSASGRLVSGVMAIVNAYVPDYGRENVIATHKEIVAEGRCPGKPSYGYKAVEDKHQPWEVVRGEAEIVKEIFQQFADGGTYRGIAMDLNDRGVSTKQDGQGWDATQIRKMLKNPVYIGQFRWGGEIHEGIHEPLVDTQLWSTVQRIIRQHKGRPRGPRVGSLNRLMVCGVCGNSIYCNQSKTAGYRYYRCGGRVRLALDIDHEPVSVSEPKLDKLIWTWVRENIECGRVVQGFKDYFNRMAGQNGEGALAAKINQVKATMEKNLDAYHADALTLEQLRERNQPLKMELRQLETRLNNYVAIDPGAVDAVLEVAADSLDWIENEAESDDQVKFLSVLLDRVELRDDSTVALFPAWTHEPEVYVIPAYWGPVRGGDFDLVRA